MRSMSAPLKEATRSSIAEAAHGGNGSANKATSHAEIKRGSDEGLLHKQHLVISHEGLT